MAFGRSAQNSKTAPCKNDPTQNKIQRQSLYVLAPTTLDSGNSSDVWTACIIMYSISVGWGLLSVILEVRLLQKEDRRIANAGERLNFMRWRRVNVRCLLLVQCLLRISFFASNPTGSYEVKNTELYLFMDIAAWNCQFMALALVAQSWVDVLTTNMGIHSYTRFQVKRRRVWGKSLVAVAFLSLAVWMVAVLQDSESWGYHQHHHHQSTKGTQAHFVASCLSFCLSLVLVFLASKLRVRLPSGATVKLLVLSGVCTAVFAVIVANGCFTRITGSYISGPLDAVIYPWLIYVVPDILPDIVIFACFAARLQTGSSSSDEGNQPDASPTDPVPTSVSHVDEVGHYDLFEENLESKENDVPTAPCSGCANALPHDRAIPTSLLEPHQDGDGRSALSPLLPDGTRSAKSSKQGEGSTKQ